MQAICLWSGPRNISTALMYSFAQRPDTKVVDEPLYGHYLRVTNAEHPGREDVLQSMDCDGPAVMRRLLQTPLPADVFFIKHMAHHLLEMDLAFMQQTHNVFLIRNPRDMLPSLTIQVPHATLADTGLKRQWQLIRMLKRQGQSPAIIDARKLQQDPAGIISALCHHLSIAFHPGMLNWPAGPIAEDGIWAKHWYHSVHLSTGFSAYVAKENFPPELLPLLNECQPFYEKLLTETINAPPT